MTTRSAIILAAGKGTRMNSDLPKVAHEVAGAPMVCWVVDACARTGCSRIIVVVGYMQEVVRAAIEARDWGDVEIDFAVQAEQLGTGHAVGSASGLMADAAAAPGHEVLVLAGDGPLIRAETLQALADRHRATGAAATLATARLEDPEGYGRIVRDANGVFAGIVEQKNATPDQLRIREVNPSYYCFDAFHLFRSLGEVRRDEVSGEYYITDVPSLLQGLGERVEVIEAVPAADVLSINTASQLAEVDAILRKRLGQTPETSTHLTGGRDR